MQKSEFLYKMYHRGYFQIQEVKSLKKIINIISMMVIIMIIVTGCSKPVSNKQPTVAVENIGKNLKIMTTNQLLYFMVKDITKDKNEVEYMFNDVKEQWDFQYSEDSLQNISSKDLFLYMGADFEPWASAYINKLDKSKVGIFDVSRGTNIISYEGEVKYNDTIIKNNPYYWLNENNYFNALFNIMSALQENDPANRDFYNKNFSDYVKSVDIYNKAFKDISNDLKQYTFLVSGDNLDYYLKYNNLNYVKVPADLFPTALDNLYKKIDEDTADSKKIIFLYCNDNDLIKNDTIIKKYNLKCVNLIDYKRGYNYLDILNYNLQSLKVAVTAAATTAQTGQ